MFASLATVVAAQTAPIPWTPRFNWKHTYRDITTEHGDLKPFVENTDPFAVGYVLDESSLTANGTLGLFRPRVGLGLPPTAFRVDVAQHQILGLGSDAEAGYAPQTPWPATAVMARAADGTFRIEWDPTKG